MTHSNDGRLSRRAFLAASGLTVAGSLLEGQDDGSAAEPVIDIHQHLNYSGRTDQAFLAHQQKMGATLTILLPAGRVMTSPSTHGGESNGLEAQCLGNEACRAFAAARPQAYRFAANDVPDAPGAVKEIGRRLRQGALLIAEQKFGVECDAPAMHAIYRLAEER
ncbi:MAG: amidohydrolase, partial [Acidobacteriota bacterium]